MALQTNELKHGLKTRHVTMISIGGVIGAGLFIGSGTIIDSAGPGAILSYIIAGLMIVLIMRMLGEMAVVNPDSGSFSTYAHQAFRSLGRIHDRLVILVQLGYHHCY